MRNLNIRKNTPDKLADLNRTIYAKTSQFSLKPAKSLVVEAVENVPKRSIIKKESTIKSSDQLNEAIRVTRNRKVQFADLQFVDDIDTYIRDEERSYTKVTKLSQKQKKVRDSLTG